jgi:uncharacterized membrane protein YkvA (DUF1232 family)
MELSDILKYKDLYSKSAFAEKIGRVAKRAGSKLIYAALIMYYTLESDQVSLKDKALIIGALGYLISPLDVVPDAIPIAGLGDDLAVIMLILKNIWGNVNDDAKQKAKEKLSQWFDDDEIINADDIFKEDVNSNPV